MTRRRTPRQLSPSGPQRGYVLIVVTLALALLAALAARFALRVDTLRENASALQAYADGQLAVADARAMAWYWLATRPIGQASVGFVDEQPLQVDGRWYRFGNDAWVAVQDQRGLLSINAVDRAALRALLVGLGIDSGRADGWVDVLEDFLDNDNLRRANGAEAPEYVALGLAPPRNDWVLALPEVCRLPQWRDAPAVCDQALRMMSTRRDALFNPNTAPPDALRAKLPSANADQLALLQTLRGAAPFANGNVATSLTGLPLARDDFLYFASNGFRVTVWAPGLPRALEYNLTIVPGLPTSPWLVQEAALAARPEVNHPTTRAAAFPTPSSDVARAAAPAASAP
jgi:type II secretory pathway component PulK